MTQAEFLARITDCLDQARIPLMVAGSLASSFHGRPRATNDVDRVIDPSRDQLDRFLALLGPGYYASPEAAHEAFAGRSMFNVIDFSGGWKADLIIRKDRLFSREEFRRRQTGVLEGVSLPIASPEDVMLTKLEWNKITPSQRQVEDALHVAIVKGPTLDEQYLRTWASVLGVSDALEDLLQKAKQFQP